MRLIRLLIALLCLAVGLAVGALHHQPVVIDLGFNTLHATLGVSLLVALLVGALIGGLAVTASVVLPLRQRLRRAGTATTAVSTIRDGN
jgi:uncharacterized integral membrane protein